MEEKDRKRHRMSRSWQITIYLLIAMCALFPFVMPGAIEEKLDVFIAVAMCFLPLGGLALFQLFIHSVVTSPAGIEWYFLNFRKFVPWSAVEQLDINPFGFVSLRFRDEVKVSYRDISTYVSDWRASELVLDIQRFAPHVEIPTYLTNRSPIRWFQIPGVILVLLVMHLLFMGVMIQLARQTMLNLGLMNGSQFPVLIQAVVSGFAIGVFSGAASVWAYNAWLFDRQSDRRITLQALLCYIQPWSGALLGGILGILLFLVWPILFGPTKDISKAGESLFPLAGLIGSIAQIYIHPRLMDKIDSMP